MLFRKYSIPIPADVPKAMESTFNAHYTKITKKTDRLFLFAYDQKMEHLNKDFYGPTVHPDAQNCEHPFSIAHAGYVGAFATHLGLIARYGKKYPAIPYIAKLNGKTDMISTDHKDPYSKQLWTVDDAVRLKENHSINICGVGYTLYLGSEYEADMLSQAAQIITQAHRNGLVAILWVYARGKYITHDQDPFLITGAAGIAASLGADFVKLKAPLDALSKTSYQWLEIAAHAAGNTKIICAGGPQVAYESLFSTIHAQMQQGHVAGCALGRNIFQHSTADAIAVTKAVSALVYDTKTPEQALKMVIGKK